MAYVGNSNNNTTEIRTTRFRFTATEGQVSFTGNDANGLGLSGLDSDSQVYLNGAKLSPDQDFTVPDAATIRLNVAALLNDILEVVEITKVTVVDVGGAAKRSGDTFTGGVAAPTVTLSSASQPTGSQAVKYTNTPWLGTDSIIRTNANNIAENLALKNLVKDDYLTSSQYDEGEETFLGMPFIWGKRVSNFS